MDRESEGKQERRLRIATEPEALRAFARTLGPDDQVVLEATANTWPIADLLAEHAGQVVVSNPLRTRAIADAKIKTDQVDARTLAQLLAADFIPTVWVPDPATRALRGRIARHRALVQQRTRLRNQVHAALIRSLVQCPHSDLFGRAGRRWLDGVTLAGHAAARLRAVATIAAVVRHVVVAPQDHGLTGGRISASVTVRFTMRPSRANELPSARSMSTMSGTPSGA